MLKTPMDINSLIHLPPGRLPEAVIAVIFKGEADRGNCFMG